jgi:V8-like Glu-specific endopeptidase
MSKSSMCKSLRLFVSSLAIAGLAACANPMSGSNSTIKGDLFETGIMGGVNATGTEEYAKSVVALYNVQASTLCTASIISKSFLVTAAHCVAGTPAQLRVVFGTDLQTKNLVVQAVEQTQTSPMWATRQNEDTNTGDIALVKFTGGLPAGFQPVSLLTDVSQLKDGETVMLAGYGLSDGVAHTGAGVLRSVSIPIMKVAYSTSEILMDQHDGRGACHGDSGGPAYVTVNGKLALIGVTSRGVNDPNNTCNVSAAYTSIAFYAKWIVSTAKSMMLSPVPQPAGVTPGTAAPAAQVANAN